MTNRFDLPAALPSQVIVRARSVGVKVGQSFYLRLEQEDSVTILALSAATQSPQQARRQAKEMGHNPTHWIVSGTRVLRRFY